MKIHLVRHGKTMANEKRLYCGATDLELAKSGIEEITFLKQKNIYAKCDIFICSPLKRAIQTLNIIYDNPKYYIYENIKEINFGIFEMKHHKELSNNKEYINWIEDVENYKIKNGESKKEFRTRVLKVFYDILEKYKNYENICIVTHGGVIATIMEELLKNEKNFFDWQPQNGQGYIIDINNENIAFKKIGENN